MEQVVATLHDELKEMDTVKEELEATFCGQVRELERQNSAREQELTTLREHIFSWRLY
jgi:hypothetical protein